MSPAPLLKLQNKLFKWKKRQRQQTRDWNLGKRKRLESNILGVKPCGMWVMGKACEDGSHHRLRNGRAPQLQCKMGLTLWYCGIFSVPFPLLLGWNVLAHHIY